MFKKETNDRGNNNANAKYAKCLGMFFFILCRIGIGRIGLGIQGAIQIHTFTVFGKMSNGENRNEV